MEFTATQIFDIAIICFTFLYVVICKIATRGFMPRVNYAYTIPGQVARALGKSKWRLFTHAPFMLLCVGFVVCRSIVFLYSIDVEAWAAWFVCILAGLYVTNVLLFHTAFKILANSVVLKPTISQG